MAAGPGWELQTLRGAPAPHLLSGLQCSRAECGPCVQSWPSAPPYTHCVLGCWPYAWDPTVVGRGEVGTQIDLRGPSCCLGGLGTAVHVGGNSCIPPFPSLEALGSWRRQGPLGLPDSWSIPGVLAIQEQGPWIPACGESGGASCPQPKRTLPTVLPEFRSPFFQDSFSPRTTPLNCSTGTVAPLCQDPLLCPPRWRPQHQSTFS